jgi:hypothetical protein
MILLLSNKKMKSFTKLFNGARFQTRKLYVSKEFQLMQKTYVLLYFAGDQLKQVLSKAKKLIINN